METVQHVKGVSRRVRKVEAGVTWLEEGRGVTGAILATPCGPGQWRLSWCRRHCRKSGTPTFELMSHRFLILVLAWAATYQAVPAVAQVAPADAASPYIAAQHWSVALLRRLDAAGLIPAHSAVGHGSVTRTEVATLLRDAMSAVRSEDMGMLRALEQYHRSFCDEYEAACRLSAGKASSVLRGSILSAGYSHHTGATLTALGRRPASGTPPAPAEDLRSAYAAADLAASGAHVGATVLASASGDGIAIEEGYAVGVLGPLGAWVGRRAVGLGYGRGSLLLSGRVPADGVGIETAAFRLPWLFRHLGPFRFSTGIQRLDSVAPFDDPWLWTTRATIDPHPRFRIGLNRAAMVAVESDDQWTRIRRVAEVLIGKHSVANEMDNQIASVDLRYRPPMLRVPLALYVEWGFEDSAGAWRDVPGVIAGAYLAAIPGLPVLALGLERASFAGSCCGNPPWYRHGGFIAGWTDSRIPLGHELGGQGYEWRAWSDAAVSGTLMTMETFFRKRYSENLYAPTREGSSAGVRLTGTVRASSELELRTRAFYERGETGWAELSLALTGAYLF